jgi:hypothetical protein
LICWRGKIRGCKRNGADGYRARRGFQKKRGGITTVENEKTGKRRIENDLFAISIAIAHGNKPHKFCKDGYGQRTIAWQPFPEPYKEDTE